MKKIKINTLPIFLIVMVFLCFSCAEEETPDYVEIPFVVENGKIVLEATVNGRNGRFTFDTGTTESYLDINVKNLWIQGYGTVTYKGRPKLVFIYKLNRITFGDVELKTKSWVINRSDIVTKKLEAGYSGLLGARIFEGYWCEISFSKGKIILRKEKPDYFTKYSPVNILSKFDADFYIPVSIDDNDHYFLLDTGMPAGIYFPDGITNISKSEYLDVLTEDGERPYHIVKTNKIHILDETYEGAYVITNSVLVDLLGETFNDRGMLGIDFLKYYDFLFDYRDLRNGKSTGLYYEPNTPLEERNYGFWGLLKEPPEFGVIDYTIKDDNIVILSVVKGSIAHTQFGALPGMIVTKINGKSYKEFFTGETLDPSFYLTIDNYTILKDGVEQTIVLALNHEISASN